jgi:crotonobetainyl-CoA:carnitine CoA-transferase CaiB-like acyl-CoA transferase
MMRKGERGGPLAGIRVLDLSAYIAGPYGCALLADMGAEVTKIEPPGGETFRNYPSTLADEARGFVGVNRSKRGLVLDLKQEEGREALDRLVETVDVLVHNFRPSVPPRLGIDYPRLREINPRLIYCGLTGYGDTGPLKDKAGYDQVLQAMTGICTFQGRAAGGGEGEPQVVLGSVVDYYASAMLASGVTAALYEREKTGLGQSIGVSLLRSALAMQSARMVWAQSEPREVGRDMRSGGITGIHPTRDGYLYISANTPHFWTALCELVGLVELAADPAYDTVRKRAAKADEIVARIRAALALRTAFEWETLFGERVPCSAVRTVEDLFDHPQVAAQNLVVDLEHSRIGRYRGFAGAIGFGDCPAPAAFAAPALGQDSEDLLVEVGYDAEQIEHLRSLGVLG